MSVKDILESAGGAVAPKPRACPACGYAFGGEVEPIGEAEPSNMDETVNDPEEERRRFVTALQRGGY